MSYLAVPISAVTFETACEQIKTAVAAGAELLELRADYLKPLDPELVVRLIEHARSAKATPPGVIVTCRSKQQGGARFYADQLRLDVLASAVRAGADFIDLEFDSFNVLENQEKIRLALSVGTKTRLILSAHDFKGPFDDIAGLYRRIITTYPAAIPKLVCTANHINDCFDVFDLLGRTSDDRIIFCMGAAGVITRLIAKKFDSLITYASIDNETATAPGQLTVEQFKNLYRGGAINRKTELYGVIGYPIDHSLSPAVHNACFADAGLNKLYLPIAIQGDQDEFDYFIRNVVNRRWLDFKGFSVTIPHKRNALDLVNARRGKVEPLTEIIGAGNTLLLGPDDRISAYNTDCKGALDAIKAAGVENLRGLTVAVVGAGGAARAIIAGLVGEGADVTIYNRTVKKAERLAEEFNCRYALLKELAELDASLVVNCTSLGMNPNVDSTPLAGEYLNADMVVFDAVYNPPETQLLKDARSAGAKVVSGLDMFVNQAAAQFKLFTGVDPNTDLMRNVIADQIGKNR